MKIKSIALMLIFVLMLSAFCGCGSANSGEAVDDSQQATTQQAADIQSRVPTDVDYSVVYNKLLSDTYKFIANYTEEAIPDEGQYGISEAIGGLDTDKAISRVGYVPMDINGDSVPEMLIVAVNEDGSEACLGTRVLAAYTCHGGEVKLVFEGSSRNRFYILDDGTIYNEGSSGAAYDIFAVYTLPANGTKLAAKDFYFTSPVSENSSETGYFHNTKGVPDVAESQQFTDSMDGFEKKQKEFSGKIRELELTSFDKVEVQEVTDAVYAELAEYSSVDIGSCSEYVADESEYQTTIIFYTESEVEDFKLLKLEYIDVNIYNAYDAYTYGVMNADNPLAVTLTLGGAVPTYGISYIDENGNEVRRAIEISGADGSLLLSEF